MVRSCCCVAIAAAASAAIAGGNDIDRFGLSRERGSCNERVRTTFTTIAVKSTIDKGIVELLSSFLPTWLLLLFFFVDTVPTLEHAPDYSDLYSVHFNAL